MLDRDKIAEILQEAAATNPLVAKSVFEISDRTAAMRDDQRYILKSLEDSPEKIEKFSGDGLNKLVCNNLEQDQQAIKLFNASLTPAHKWQVRNNRLPLIIQATINYFTGDDNVVHTLASGKLPININFDEYMNTLYPLNYSSNFWGNNDATLFSNAVLSVCWAINKTTINDFKHTSIAHVAASPFPTGFTERGCRYAYNFGGKTGLGFVHGGYAYGGARDEFAAELGLDKAWDNKKFKPQDCSSWIAEITNSPEAYSTLDQLYLYRKLTGQTVDTSKWSANLLAHFENTYSKAVELKDIEPGDIYITRSNVDQSNNYLGTGGHTGIVVGLLDSKDALVANYTRNMEKQLPLVPSFTLSKEIQSSMVHGAAGGGVAVYPLVDADPKVQTMFLRPKSSITAKM